jgi:hypothetical protein
MKFTLKVKAVSVLAIAALGALQAAHAQVDSTGITALRGTPRLEAAAPTPSQAAGTVCGLGSTYYSEKKSGWSWGVASFTCNGISVSYSPGAAKWTAPCPSGFAGRTQGGALPYSTTVIAFCEKT